MIAKRITSEDQLVDESPLEVGHGEARTLRDSVEYAMKNYFERLDGQDVTDVYQMVLIEVEAPLLETVMKHVRGNQTKAANLLGLNRGTLRKKLKLYDLL